MQERKVKVGIIGLGHNGLAHAKCHKHSEKSELVALCDCNEDLLRKAGDELGVEKQYSGNDFFDDPEMEAVSINTGDNHHTAPFIKAVTAGKHVLVEKPLANSKEDVLAMVKATDKASPGLKIQVGYILRFNPVFQKIHEMAEANELGKIYYMEADYIHNLVYQKEKTDPVTGSNWYLENELPMVGGGSHPLDVLRWIKGKQVTHVWSYSNHVAFPEMANDDCMVSLFRFEDGTIAKVATLYAPRCECPSYYNLRVYGTRGTVERDQIAVAKTEEEAHPPFRPIEAERLSGHPYDLEIEDWLDAILEDRPVRTNLKDGGASTLATLLAVRSARERKEIEVPRLY